MTRRDLDEFLDLVDLELASYQRQAIDRLLAEEVPAPRRTVARRPSGAVHGHYPQLIVIDEAAEFGEPYFPEEVTVEHHDG